MKLGDVAKYVNIRGLVVDYLLKAVIEPAIQNMVAASPNKLDDAAAAMLLPLAEKALVDLVDVELKKIGA